MNNFDITTATLGLICVECDHAMTHTSGPDSPRPGDLSLCIRCGSLNIYDDAMRFRRPTIDEYLQAAADRELQRLRRAILSIPQKVRHG
ncbi:MAG: hypothetical protein K2X43_01090 [Hyphomonadaceae bacterium]|nr:hypothetical protein [Hyphomonadaceae bacterium]